MDCPKCGKKTLDCGTELELVDLRSCGEAPGPPAVLTVKATHSRTCQWCGTNVSTYELVQYVKGPA